jgi:NhaP-type Na+/H+ or K+/H+ antiporter
LAALSSPGETLLNARSRKLIGAVALIAFVIVYALVAAALAQSRPLQDAAFVWRVIGYAVLGLAWTFPAGALIRWMERRGRRD